MRSKAMFLVVVVCLAAFIICSGCGGNYADKIISPQITAAVRHSITTTVSRSIPMSDITMYFASRGGAEFIGPREIIIYDPMAITGEHGGKIGGKMAWVISIRPSGNNLIITIPSDADYHICINGQCVTLKKEVGQ